MIRVHTHHWLHRQALYLQSIAASTIIISSGGCGSRTTLDEGYAAPAESTVVDAGRIVIDAARDAVTRPPEKPACEATLITIDQLRPTVTLLVDQSSSMAERYPDRTSIVTRWSLVHDALLDPENGVIRKLQLSIRFGIAFFTSHNGSSTGTCPIVSEVRAATNNYEAISALYNRMGPDDDTPTGDSIDKVVESIEGSPSGGPQSILLVTDGLPDTCAVPDPQLGQSQAIAAAQRAYGDGIDMYVLGISSDIAGENLQQLANAGKGKPVDNVWGRDKEAVQSYEASESVAGLTAQFVEILERVPFCEVRLRREVLASEARTARVELDGRPLSFGDRDGFALRDPRRLVIVGAACEAIKSGGKELDVRISCD
jgi:hypothetical protein